MVAAAREPCTSSARILKLYELLANISSSCGVAGFTHLVASAAADMRHATAM